MVEAKRLTPKGAEESQEIFKRGQIAVEQRWKQFNNGNKFENQPISAWSKILTMGNESQLRNYADDLKLQTGYGVLTNGYEWQIYDMSKRGGFSEKLVSKMYILTDPVAHSAEKLKVLWRKSEKWPGM